MHFNYQVRLSNLASGVQGWQLSKLPSMARVKKNQRAIGLPPGWLGKTKKSVFICLIFSQFLLLFSLYSRMSIILRGNFWLWASQERQRKRERKREREREKKKNFQQHLTSKSLMWIFATDLISLFLSLTCSLSFLLFLSLSVSLSHSCHSLWHALARSQSCSCMLSLLLLLALALCFSPCFTLSFVHSHQQKQRHQ